jgi:two-component sensor histidine kinase
MVRDSIAAGHVPEAIGREQAWLDQRRRQRGAYSVIRRLPDGRSFRVTERRMPNHGIAVVWTDISDLVGARDQIECSLRDSEAMNRRLSAEMEERARAEEALRLAKSSLEATVAARTAELTRALAQRDALLREVYHRVRNNLQIVDSLIRMETARITDPLASDALGALRDRLQILALIHAQLMSSEDLRSFPVVPFLQQLIDNLSDSLDFEPCVLTVTVTANGRTAVTMDLALPMGLLATELVTNAATHAKRNGKPAAVTIGFHAESDSHFELVVADDGDDPAAPRNFLTRGAVGSHIVHGLLGQLDVEMKISYYKGTKIAVRLPIRDDCDGG